MVLNVKSCVLDPFNIIELSEFSSDILPFVPLKRPPNDSKVCQLTTNHRTVSSPILDAWRLSPPATAAKERGLGGFNFDGKVPNIHTSFDEEKVDPASIVNITGKTANTPTAHFEDRNLLISRDLKRASHIPRSSFNKIVVTKERILESRAKTYDNPIKALMIPAANQKIVTKKKPRKMKKKNNSDQKVVTISLFKNYTAFTRTQLL